MPWGEAHHWTDTHREPAERTIAVPALSFRSVRCQASTGMRAVRADRVAVHGAPRASPLRHTTPRALRSVGGEQRLRGGCSRRVTWRQGVSAGCSRRLVTATAAAGGEEGTTMQRAAWKRELVRALGPSAQCCISGFPPLSFVGLFDDGSIISIEGLEATLH